MEQKYMKQGNITNNITKDPIVDKITIASKIGRFYAEKHGWDTAAANKEILSLRISDIVINSDGIEIHLSRPGLLIGRRGTNIEALQRFLGCRIHIEEVNDISDYMLVYDPEDFY